ncbi:hypothetical protein CP979_11775 [Streptomyces filamentosus]|nr:hypothetical protein CP979_11775 [Streptomyces filamentosus]
MSPEGPRPRARGPSSIPAGAAAFGVADKSVRKALAALCPGTRTGHWMTALAIDPFSSGHVRYGTGNGIWRSRTVFPAGPWSSTGVMAALARPCRCARERGPLPRARW